MELLGSLEQATLSALSAIKHNSSTGLKNISNHDFKQRLEEIGVKTLRIVNTHDWIPQMPGIFMNEWLHKKCHEILNSKGLMETMERMSFIHVGAELRINLKENAGVRFCQSLQAHLHLVDGFQSSRVPFRPSAKRDYALVNKTSNLLKDELSVPANWHNLSTHYDSDLLIGTIYQLIMIPISVPISIITIGFLRFE